MKIKKRYFIACVLLCIAAVALSIGVFSFEMGLARFSKLNKITKSTWIETSASEVGSRVNTDLMITKIIPADGTERFSYIGKQQQVNGKAICYKKEVWLSNVIVTGKNPVTGDDYKIGDRVTIFYKPDNPRLVYVYTSCTPYILLLIVSFILAIGIIVACKIINKSMKEDTFSDASVTIMDIPMLVMLAGFLLCFFAGMIIGNIQVDATYTSINQVIAELISSGEVTF